MHVTAGALLVCGTEILLVGHRAYGIVLQPGGHIESPVRQRDPRQSQPDQEQQEQRGGGQAAEFGLALDLSHEVFQLRRLGSWAGIRLSVVAAGAEPQAGQAALLRGRQVRHARIVPLACQGHPVEPVRPGGYQRWHLPRAEEGLEPDQCGVAGALAYPLVQPVDDQQEPLVLQRDLDEGPQVGGVILFQPRPEGCRERGIAIAGPGPPRGVEVERKPYRQSPPEPPRPLGEDRRVGERVQHQVAQERGLPAARVSDQNMAVA
jgi:hypothetical protein